MTCDHNSYAGGWHNIRRDYGDNEVLECGGCHDIIESRLDLINQPLKFENVDVEITGWSPTQIIIRKKGTVLDWIEVQDEGGYEGSYNVHNVRNLAAIKQSKAMTEKACDCGHLWDEHMPVELDGGAYDNRGRCLKCSDCYAPHWKLTGEEAKKSFSALRDGLSK